VICFAMVVIAYALGHGGGYRMCKLRFKNVLKRKIQANQSSFTSQYTATITGVYSSLLQEVTKL
jgi:hypothetical protein